MENKQSLIVLDKVRMYFPLKKRSVLDKQQRFVKAVDGVNLDIRKGETFGLVGESGCGKSTLGRVILQLYRQTAGSVVYHKPDENGDAEAIDLGQCRGERLRLLRRDLQMVFQDPYSSLNPRMTVGQLISEALVAHKMFKPGAKETEAYILDIMDKCGLQPYMVHRYPHQFSGGQRQRIGIARALALQPKFVVCDEAVSALDVSIQSQIINLLMDLKEQENLTYLFISHDLSAVKFISDRIGVMYLGDLIECSDSETLFTDPLHPYTEALMNAIPTTEDEANRKLQIIEGDIPSPIDPPPGCKFHTRCKYCKENCRTDAPEWREWRPGHFIACHYPLLEEQK